MRLALSSRSPSQTQFAAAAAAQLVAQVRPQRSSLEVVVDEDVVQSIETPRLHGQRRGAHARLDERNALPAQRVQERSTATEHAGDRQLDALEIPPEPQLPQALVRLRRRRRPGSLSISGWEERQLDQVGGHEAMPMHRDQQLSIAFGQHDRRSGRDLLRGGQPTYVLATQLLDVGSAHGTTVQSSPTAQQYSSTSNTSGSRTSTCRQRWRDND
jgi:hypothetical protein